MNVQQILRLKKIGGVETIAPSATVTEAARRLSQLRIGALVVSADGRRVDGILSERDIVRELGQRGPACMTDRVAALMTAKVASCTPEDTAEAVLSRMSEGRFRHMPVVEDGRLTGVVSIGDVVKARLIEIESERHALEDMIRGF